MTRYFSSTRQTERYTPSEKCWWFNCQWKLGDKNYLKLGIEIKMPPNILLMSNFESSYLINLISAVERVGSVSSGEEI